MNIVTFERLCALNELTIRLVEKHKDETRESAKISVPSNTKIPCASRRAPFVANVESILCVWLKDEKPNGLSVIGAVVMERAMTDCSPQGPPPGHPQEFCLAHANTILNICPIPLQPLMQEIITIFVTFKICYFLRLPRYEYIGCK